LYLTYILLLTRKLLNQGFLLAKLRSSLRNFYGRHNDLVDRYGISVTNDHCLSSSCVPYVAANKEATEPRVPFG
jgi:hypothetical protein